MGDGKIFKENLSKRIMENNELKKLVRITRKGTSFEEISAEFGRCIKKLGSYDLRLQEYIKNYTTLRSNR